MDTRPRSGTGMVLELSRVSAGDRDRVGAKAANLAVLMQEGFPVPNGVVLSTGAFAACFSNDPTDTADPLGVEHATGRPGLGHLLTEVMAVMGDVPLAVRSSGVAEDLPVASFAGQYETVLDVKGLDELATAVLRCWASADSTHATAYLESHRLQAASMAVLIQEMVQADVAGVAFSANPVTGHRHEVVINAVPGLGDRLVSGEVSPDQWLVNGDEALCEGSPHGVIDSDEARAIAEMVREVAAHFGTPQDIEWAMAQGRLHVLQARPITALPEPPIEPVPVPVEVPPGFWFHDGSHGNSHVPIDRFLMELVPQCSRRWCEEFGYLFDGIEFREIGGSVYQRMIPPGDRQGPTLPNWLMRILVRVVPDLRRRVKRATGAFRSDLPGRYIDLWYTEWQPEMAGAIAHLRDIDLATLSDDGLGHHILEARELMARGVLLHMRLHGAMAPILRDLVGACEDLLGWDLAKSMELVSGTSYMSTEPARRLRELADMATGRPQVMSLLDDPDEDVLDRLAQVDPEFADDFAGYLREHGCRALGHTTLGEVTLAESPRLLLGMISGLIELGYDPQQDFDENARKRAEALQEVETLVADRPTDLDRLRRAIGQAEKAYPVREDNQFYCFSAPLALLRYAALEIGHRLVARGRLGAADDVLYLELDEAVAALAERTDQRPLVRRRKGEQAWTELHPGPPSYGTPPPGPPSFGFLPADARPLMEAIIWSNEAIMAVTERDHEHASSESIVTGIPASPGTYAGPVRVVMDESQFAKIRPGDVLVCQATSPVWSVVFPLIGALVTDTGGLLSHPAIIAREYRIPAVVATGDATSRLHDGDLITVDGTAGTVMVEAAAEAHGPPWKPGRRDN